MLRAFRHALLPEWRSGDGLLGEPGGMWRFIARTRRVGADGRFRSRRYALEADGVAGPQGGRNQSDKHRGVCAAESAGAGQLGRLYLASFSSRYAGDGSAREQRLSYALLGPGLQGVRCEKHVWSTYGSARAHMAALQALPAGRTGAHRPWRC